MTNLVSQLLDVARLENAHELNLAPVDVSLMLTSTWFMTPYATRCREYRKKKDFHHLQYSTPHISIVAHEVSFTPCHYKLVDNAIKFTNFHHRHFQPSLPAVISKMVTDNGIGIEPENLEHIWDRMY